VNYRAIRNAKENRRRTCKRSEGCFSVQGGNTEAKFHIDKFYPLCEPGYVIPYVCNLTEEKVLCKYV
jgi:hypothetical protein